LCLAQHVEYASRLVVVLGRGGVALNLAIGSVVLGLEQTVHQATDAVALLAVVEPKAPDAGALVAVKQERRLRLQLQAAGDRLHEGRGVQSVVDEDAVEGLRVAVVYEEGSLDVRLFPLVLRRVERVEGDVRGRVHNLLGIRVDLLDGREVHSRDAFVGHCICSVFYLRDIANCNYL